MTYTSGMMEAGRHLGGHRGIVNGKTFDSRFQSPTQLGHGSQTAQLGESNGRKKAAKYKIGHRVTFSVAYSLLRGIRDL